MYQLDTKDGVVFDLSGQGNPSLYSWTQPDSDVAFLIYDKDGTGQVTSGKQLLGGATVPGKNNGFAALRTLAGDIQWGYIDATHGGDVWSKLKLWHDRNHDGVAQPDELEPVADVLDAIGLGYYLSPRRDGVGDLYRYRGWARLKGETRTFDIFDVLLTAPK